MNKLFAAASPAALGGIGLPSPTTALNCCSACLKRHFGTHNGAMIAVLKLAT